ncbi:MAG: 7-carboxy-7-deazaguanine synthase QueE [Bacteroidales bacterium]|nr:MAG: 7-carboxy-7-deazaguanine synthase QueE [Bacteroidales bacterium]
MQLTDYIKQFDSGKCLPLVEEFYTLQGEGYHTGRAAYFIRIGGCDVGCAWCDSKLSWNPEIFPPVSVDEIVAHAEVYPGRAIVVTGGEPSLYPLDYLCSVFKRKGFQTFIETSGAYDLSGQWDWICLSPKQQQPPIGGIHLKADELKVIISEPNDIHWAEENSRLVKSSCQLYLQPEWSKFSSIIPWLVDYAMNNPKWKISLQAHKFMHIP